jgi:hypothetical protein
MAKRRQRQAAAAAGNRWLISDRTAKGLRTLATPQHIYRGLGAMASQQQPLLRHGALPCGRVLNQYCALRKPWQGENESHAFSLGQLMSALIFFVLF